MYKSYSFHPSVRNSISVYLPYPENVSYSAGLLSTVPTKSASYCYQPDCGSVEYSMCKFPKQSVSVTDFVTYSANNLQHSNEKCLESISPI
jgi:hypothetical protein